MRVVQQQSGILTPDITRLIIQKENKEILALNNSLDQINLIDCCRSTTKSGLALCDPMDGSMTDFPVLHHLPEFAQTYVH